MIFLRILSFIFLIVASRNVANSQHVAVTGVQTGIKDDGTTPYRRDIRDLQKDTPSWSLFIQALKLMQTDFENNPLSYYQISGIHGRPYIPWDNFPHAQDGTSFGYCTHGSALFLTWHRPYIALFEQALAIHAQRVAKTYPARLLKIFTAAADNLRMPYWDWASNPRMPDFFNSQYVVITTASGGSQSVTNPLATFKFQSPQPPDQFPVVTWEGDGHLAATTQTLRSPDSPGGSSNFNRANNELANQNLKEQTYLAFTKIQVFNNFSTYTNAGGSLEGIHNGIHAAIGGAWGHMSWPSYAAFDPAFWMLHSNTDRLTALYQAMYPDQFLTPDYDRYGTFARGRGDIDASTPLSPFAVNSQGDLHKSLTIRSLSALGYAYPELPYWKQSPEQLQSSAISTVATLYGPNSNGRRRRSHGARQQISEWGVAISVSRYGVGGKRFVIRVFLGDVPKNPSDWPTTPILVGSFALFPPPLKEESPPPDTLAYYEISLDKSLSDRGYDGQDIAATTEYLKSNLHWRVQLLDGSVASTEDVQCLNVKVQEDLVTLGRDVSELPTYGDTIIHSDITKGKTGGYVA